MCEARLRHSRIDAFPVSLVSYLILTFRTHADQEV